MKKLVCTFLLLAGVFGTAFADTEDKVTIIPTVGFSLPINSFKVGGDYDSSFTQNNYNYFDASGFIIFNKTNIALRCMLSAGVAIPDKKITDPDKKTVGNDAGFGIGAGYAVINTKKMNLILSAITDVAYSNYGNYETKVYSNDLTLKTKNTYEMVVFEYGGSIDFVYRLSNCLGITAGVKCAGQVGQFQVKTEQTGKDDKKNQYDMTGFTIVPRIGLSWTF